MMIYFFLINRHGDEHSEILHIINVLNLFCKIFDINTKH